MTTQTVSSTALAQAFAIDAHLLNNRYFLELEQVKTIKGEYEQRSAKIALDRKYHVVRTALKGLYDLGIQHNCNLKELLENYNVVVGQVVK